jgi:hypothetical protein
MWSASVNYQLVPIPPGDFLEFDDFIHLAEESIEKLTEASHDIAIVVGSPSRNPVIEGKICTIPFIFSMKER